MDGIQATHAIRQENRKDAKTIPIIAMPADAFEEEKKRGFAVGLTDYITKTAGIQEMIDII